MLGGPTKGDRVNVGTKIKVQADSSCKKKQANLCLVALNLVVAGLDIINKMK